MTNIPEIEETGSSGEQQPEPASGELILPSQESPFRPAPIEETVRGLAATKARSMGGEVAANLISGAFTQLSNDCTDAKSELGATRKALDSTRTELSNCQTREAVLKERVSTHTRGRHLRNVAIVVGTSLLGIGFELNRNNVDILSLFAGGMGILLIIMGWFWPRSEPRQ